MLRSRRPQASRKSVACFYQLRSLRQIRHRVGQYTVISLSLALLTLIPDFCICDIIRRFAMDVIITTSTGAKRSSALYLRAQSALPAFSRVDAAALAADLLPGHLQSVAMHTIHKGKPLYHLSDITQLISAR